MSKVELNKQRRRQKFEPGYLFSIDMHNGKYAFGRCIAKVSIGNVVEIFDYISDTPDFNLDITQERMFEPIIIDSFSLFRSGREGNWTVIGKTPNYVPTDVKHIRYTYGAGSTRKLVDVWGNETTVNATVAETYPDYSPRGDKDVINIIKRHKPEASE